MSKKSNKYLRISEAADLLRVTPQTIRKYRQQGKIQGYTTLGGQTIYDKQELINLIEKNNPEILTPEEQIVVHYARSSSGSKVIIENQLKQLREKYGEPDYEIKDSASGLNENRKGLWRIIQLAKDGKINLVRVTQEDRLTRFGSEYLKELLMSYGVEVEYAFDKEDKTLQEELMQDFMSLIASFSGKFYRIRGYEQQRQLLKDAEDNISSKEEKHGKK